MTDFSTVDVLAEIGDCHLKYSAVFRSHS